MVWTLRVLLLLAFALHWGGLTFYTGVVVRISHELLDNPMDGGLITQRVTTVLQYLGIVTLTLMACNCVVVLRQSRKLGTLLCGCVLVLGCSLVGLFVVHGHLDAVIDVQAAEIIDRDTFATGHRRYNQLTTVQWLASLTYLLTTVSVWRSVDSETSRSSER